MEFHDLLSKKLLHGVILTVFALVSLYNQQLPVGNPGAVVAVLPLIAWLLGQYYARAIAVSAELLDRDEFLQAQRRYASVFSSSDE